jgi:hypothetical protein
MKKIKQILKNIADSKSTIYLKNFFTKKRIILLFLVAIVLVFVYTLAIFSSARFNFYTSEEIIIEQFPAPAYQTVLRNSSAEYAITTSLDAYPGCEVTCSFSAPNYTNEIKFKGKISLQHNFSINSPIWGSGSEIFLFESACETKSSLTCKGTKAVTKKSALILQYALTVEDQRIVDNKEAYDTFLTDYANLKQNIQRTGIEYYDATFDLISIALLQYAPDSIVTKWNQERFSAIGSPQNISYLLDANAQIQSEVTEYLEKEKNLSRNYAFLDHELLVNLTGTAKTYAEPNRSKLNTVLMAFNLEHNVTFVKDIDEHIINTTFAIQTILNIQNDLDNARISIVDIAKSYNLSNLEPCAALKKISKEYNTTSPFDTYCQEIHGQEIHIPQVRIKSKVIQFNNTDVSWKLDNYLECGSTCSEDKTVVLFVHGHAFTDSSSPEALINSLEKIQTKLSIPSGGSVKLNSLFSTAKESVPLPLSFSTTYYQIVYHDIGDYTYSTQKSERIENYALRLGEVVDETRRITGVQNITLIAHSMGGLVVREYQRIFKDDNIVIITINTPHNGIDKDSFDICNLFGSDVECEDMRDNSVFLRRLNSYTPKVPIYNIYSDGCVQKEGTGDGILAVTSAQLDIATKQYVINGTCANKITFLHLTAIDPDIHPEIVDILEDILIR